MNVNSVKDDKDKYQEILKQKSAEINQKLSKKLDGVQEEMTRHFTNQEKENDRLQKQIAQLKNEKTSLQNLLIALQRRIADLEMNVGNNEENNNP